MLYMISYQLPSINVIYLKKRCWVRQHIESSPVYYCNGKYFKNGTGEDEVNLLREQKIKISRPS